MNAKSIRGGTLNTRADARRRSVLLALAWLAIAWLAVGATGAWAQGSEPRLLIPTPGGAAPQAPAVPQTPALPSPVSPPVVQGANPGMARLELRMSQLEQDLRSVTGRMEDVSFQLRKLDDRLDKLAADMEYRLGQAKSGSGGAAASTAAGGDNTPAIAAGGGAVTSTPRTVQPPASETEVAGTKQFILVADREFATENSPRAVRPRLLPIGEAAVRRSSGRVFGVPKG